jgi:hypothetical protein
MDRLALATTVMLLASCSSERVPLPRLPQLEQAQEMLGDRTGRHNECRKSARRTEDLVSCMEAKGYEFIPRSLDYPAPECWRIRDDTAGERDQTLPQAFCFLRKRAP